MSNYLFGSPTLPYGINIHWCFFCNFFCLFAQNENQHINTETWTLYLVHWTLYNTHRFWYYTYNYVLLLVLVCNLVPRPLRLFRWRVWDRNTSACARRGPTTQSAAPDTGAAHAALTVYVQLTWSSAHRRRSSAAVPAMATILLGGAH